MKVLLLALLYLAIDAGDTHAFEIDGFKSGMTKREAVRVVQLSSEYTYEDVDEYMVRIHKPDDELGGYVLSFCDTKLVRVQKDFPRTMKKFIEAAAWLTEEYGKKPTVYPSGDWFRMVWEPKPGKERVELKYIIIHSGGYGDQVAASWEVKSGCYRW